MNEEQHAPPNSLVLKGANGVAHIESDRHCCAKTGKKILQRNVRASINFANLF